MPLPHSKPGQEESNHSGDDGRDHCLPALVRLLFQGVYISGHGGKLCNDLAVLGGNSRHTTLQGPKAVVDLLVRA